MAHLTDRELLRMVSGALPESARGIADAHARRCPQCGDRLKELADTWELLGQWPLPADMPDLSDRIVRMAASEPRRRRWRWPAGRLAAKAAAAVILAAAAGYGLGWASRTKPQAGPSRGWNRTGVGRVARDLDLHALGSSPIGLADWILSPNTETREIHQ